MQAARISLLAKWGLLFLFCLIGGAGLVGVQGVGAAPSVPQAGAWEQQSPLPTRFTFDQVDMISAGEGWAVAYQDILHTTDGGVTWVHQASPTTEHLYSVRFLDAQHGWIGSNNTVLYTTNGGLTWGQGSGIIGSIYNVEFATLTKGFASYGGAVLYQTTDGGRTWTQRTMSNTIGRIQFFDANNGVANSTAGVYHTTNGGATWTLTAGPHGGTTFVTPSLGWLVTENRAERTTNGGATWQVQTVPAGTWTYDARFVDATHGWAVGNTVIRTTDGGATWLPAPVGETHIPPFWTVDFTDATHGIIAGNAGQVFSSSDGGATWVRRHHGIAGEAGDFVALDRTRVWAALTFGRVLYTTDGGQDWRLSLVGDNSVTLRSIDLADALDGWTVGTDSGGFGATFRTTDGGRTWQPQNATRQQLFAVDALDAQTAIIVGGGSEATVARRTTDGGATWHELAVGLPDLIYTDVFFLTPTTGWIVGNRNGIAKSTDGGATWAIQPAPVGYGLARIHFSDANNGWAGGYFQALLHTTNGGATWTAQNPGIPDRTHVLGVSAISPQVAWIAGYGAGPQSRPFVKLTTDGGATWIDQTPAVGPYDGFNPVLFLDAGYGWAGGAAGIFRHTDPSVPTPTPSPPPAVLVGQATWQGRPAPPAAANQLPITLTLQLGSTVTRYPNLTTDANGTVTVPVGTLPTGVYTWWVKGPQFLATGGTVTLTGAPTTSLALGMQRAGDVNNDNLVDGADFGLLRAAFGKSCGDPAYDGRADFTGDCVVDIGDFGLLRSNFGQAGPPIP